MTALAMIAVVAAASVGYALVAGLAYGLLLRWDVVHREDDAGLVAGLWPIGLPVLGLYRAARALGEWVESW